MNSRIYPTSPQLAVGAVVLVENRVLLVERGNPPGKGLWAIPGGRLRLGETLQQAAEREILEETGVLIQAGEPLLVVDVIQRDDEGRVRYHYVIVDLVAEYVGGDLKSGSDARAVRWVSPRELAHLPVNPATRDLLKAKCGF